ncbi:hypothetical protein ACTFIV_000747 [Dictyostelium citrinum]
MVVIKINQWNVRGWGTDTSFKNKIDFIKSQSPPNSLAITIVNELNADTSLAHQLFPGSIISATNRGNGIGILNHNNKNIKLSPIFIIEGRLIISDILIKDTTTRILAIYAPAQPDKRKLLASTLNNHFNNQYHNLTSNPNKNIDIIAGDFNCLDFNDNHTSSDDQGNLTTQSPDEMATRIEHVAYWGWNQKAPHSGIEPEVPVFYHFKWENCKITNHKEQIIHELKKTQITLWKKPNLSSKNES